MLGQPYVMSIPEVIGVKLVNALRPGITATDLVLTITQKLRELNVVEKFVEFFGPGMKALGATDRATIANMGPEYGATMGFFPVDEKTIEYLNMTNRKEQAVVTEACARGQRIVLHRGRNHCVLGCGGGGSGKGGSLPGRPLPSPGPHCHQ